jgi:hypothetical protein
MKCKPPFLKMFSVISVFLLAALTMAACGSLGTGSQVNTGKITICHATGNTTSAYTEITLDFNELLGHADHQDDLIPAPVGGCPTAVKTGGNTGKITICHATGSATNPYNKITIAFNALRGHSNHKGDIIPAPADGCPALTATVTPTITTTPTITATPTITTTPTLTTIPAATLPGTSTGMITICHATGSAKNPYVMITVSVNGLNGHGKHSGDIIPAPAGGCPTK